MGQPLIQKNQFLIGLKNKLTPKSTGLSRCRIRISYNHSLKIQSPLTRSSRYYRSKIFWTLQPSNSWSRWYSVS